MIKGALKHQHIRTGWPTIPKNISSKGLCLHQTRKKEGIWQKRALCTFLSQQSKKKKNPNSLSRRNLEKKGFSEIEMTRQCGISK